MVRSGGQGHGIGVRRGEHAVGQFGVGDRAGGLERPDEQCEEPDRTLVGPLWIAVVEVACDRLDHRVGPLGVGLPDRHVAPPDLVQQGCRGAAAGEIVAVRGGEVIADERLDRREAGGQGVDDGDLVRELLGDDRGDQVVLRGEVAVEGAVGQAGVSDEGRDAGAVDAVALEPASGGRDHPAPGLFLVLRAVSRHGVNLLPGACQNLSITIILLRTYCNHELEHHMASLADPLDLPSGVRLPNRIAKAGAERGPG